MRTLALFFAFAQVVFAERLHDTERDIQSAMRRHFVAHMRIAAADRLIEEPDQIAAYINARFNTLVVYDTEEDGLLKSEERVAYELEFARSHGLHVLLGKATELTDVTDDEIRERLVLWSAHGDDVILGVFFLHDDACLIRATVERQRHLYAIAHDTVPDWYVFGMIGGFCEGPPDDAVAQYFDPNAFDHLIILMYPLNGGGLDLSASTDPSEDLRRFVRGYVQRMGERFVSRLRPGQLAVLVIQAFAYYSDFITQVPRPGDIEIQATIGNAALREIAGQRANRSLAYFLWDGSRGGMLGLWQRPDWIAAAESLNRESEDRVGPVDRQP